MKLFNKLIAGVCVIALSGCATIFADNSDQITVHSNDPDAQLLVNGNMIGTGRATYTLSRDKAAILTASKPGCADATMPTDRTVVGAAYLNIIFPLGFLVDVATGKLMKADPTDYTLTPHCPVAAYSAPAVQPGYAPAQAPVAAAPAYVAPQPQPAAVAPQPAAEAPAAPSPYGNYPLVAPQPIPR